MKVAGSYQVSAPAEKVWQALTDPESLSGCIPGCDGLEPDGQDKYKAVMTVGVGPVRGKYNAKISMLDQQPFSSFKLVVEGSGGTGFANGQATITLDEQEGITTITVDSDAQVGGPVARVGQRLMDSVAKMIMDNFFKCLRESIE
ncbi:MAG: carbon monoxide dehydrogenase [Planctomyces sp.]|nr:carbon monoxide dehydrogenase [Planctomyces sp.]